MPQISVIVPVYNVEPYLPKCLDSILLQTLPDIEIICINDGSTDSSGNILQEYVQNYNSSEKLMKFYQALKEKYKIMSLKR